MLSTISADGAQAPAAAAELLPLVYEELRRLAQARLGRDPGTLQATALVHEAYLRLVGDEDPGWNGRGHFFGAAALAMRRIVVERARERACAKRGGALRRETFDEALVVGDEPSIDHLALDEALSRLEAHDARKARVVMLRYFAGLELAETAEALSIGLATVKSDWAYARAWLLREMERGAAP